MKHRTVAQNRIPRPAVTVGAGSLGFTRMSFTDIYILPYLFLG